jgi:hypothetical protein
VTVGRSKGLRKELLEPWEKTAGRRGEIGKVASVSCNTIKEFG